MWFRMILIVASAITLSYGKPRASDHGDHGDDHHGGDHHGGDTHVTYAADHACNGVNCNISTNALFAKHAQRAFNAINSTLAVNAKLATFSGRAHLAKEAFKVFVANYSEYAHFAGEAEHIIDVIKIDKSLYNGPEPEIDMTTGFHMTPGTFKICSTLDGEDCEYEEYAENSGASVNAIHCDYALYAGYADMAANCITAESAMNVEAAENSMNAIKADMSKSAFFAVESVYALHARRAKYAINIVQLPEGKGEGGENKGTGGGDGEGGEENECEEGEVTASFYDVVDRFDEVQEDEVKEKVAQLEKKKDCGKWEKGDKWGEKSKPRTTEKPGPDTGAGTGNPGPDTGAGAGTGNPGPDTGTGTRNPGPDAGFTGKPGPNNRGKPGSGTGGTGVGGSHTGKGKRFNQKVVKDFTGIVKELEEITTRLDELL